MLSPSQTRRPDPGSEEADCARLERVFAAFYLRLKPSPAPPVSVRFYAYRNLSSTIRVRGGKILIRISDLLADAPLEILSALLAILACKLIGRKPPQSHRQLYRSYILRDETRERILRSRQERGRKHLTPESGRYFDLRRIFDSLNRRYFQEELEVRRLSWSRRPNKRVLGHYDFAHDTIVVDRRLDAPRIPKYVIDFVVYHEMLHARLGEVSRNGRRYVHHRRFRTAERAFQEYTKAQRYIETRL